MGLRCTTIHHTALQVYALHYKSVHFTSLHFTAPVVWPGPRSPSACEEVACSGYLEEVSHALEEISVLVGHGAELVILPGQLSL